MMIRRWVNRESQAQGRGLPGAPRTQRGRYYVAVVTDDLFGGWNLMRFWGGCDSRRGGQMSQHYAETEVIEGEMRRIARRRQKRDYV